MTVPDGGVFLKAIKIGLNLTKKIIL